MQFVLGVRQASPIPAPGSLERALQLIAHATAARVRHARLMPAASASLTSAVVAAGG
jgi:hypothetical protein